MTAGKVSEDCLYLNVWTKSDFQSAKRPVLVFIHGGAFMEGSGAVPVYNGEGLAAKGLVVVTINYRLGILGFFTYPELTKESPHHASGNYGLLDQLAALRWVQKNIVAFGGDPQRVTIAGQSAGASSVDALTASPLAKGTFQRAIAESGLRSGGLGLMGNRSLAEQEQDGARFAGSKGFHSLAELRRATPEQLVAPAFRFGPVVDGWFLPAPLAQKNDVPILTGWTKDDITVGSNTATTLETFRQKAKQRFGERADAFLLAYPASTDEEARRAETESSRDSLRVAMFLWAVKRGETARTNAYTYWWDHVMPGPDAARFGAFHTSEVPYVMNTLSMSDRPFTDADRAIAAQVSSYWVRFATSGDPNGPGLPAWPPVRSDAALTMEIGANTGVIPVAADPEKIAFWRQELQGSAKR
jgi:para-nitrobenzyl esterase